MIDVPLEHMPVLARDGAVLATVVVDDETRNVESLLRQPWRLTLFGAVPDAGRLVRLVGFDGQPTTVVVRGRVADAHGSQPIDPDVVTHEQ